jgi:HK97 family phage major capsid protein
MNPADWLTVQLAKLADGSYASGASPLATPVTPTLWGLPVALSVAQAAGTALVGAFRTASQLFDRQKIRVDISNSHADFFVKNLVAIRCEERLALATYREAAFGQVTGLAGA